MAKLLRLPSVEDKSASKHSYIYQLIAQGLFPKPVKIGRRAVAWPENEVDAVISARIAGKSDDEIRLLVSTLAAARTQLVALIATAITHAAEQADAPPRPQLISTQPPRSKHPVDAHCQHDTNDKWIAYETAKAAWDESHPEADNLTRDAAMRRLSESMGI